MRTFGLILAAAAVAAVNGAGIQHSETGDIVITPSDGTTVFIDASAEGGKTSIQQIGAKFIAADVALTEALGTVATDLAAAKNEADDAIEALQDSVTASLGQAEDELAQTVSTLNAALGAAVTEAKGYADQAIKETVTPALVKVAADLTALEIKIKKDIDEGIKKDLEIYKNILVGTAAALPASSCGAIESVRKGSPDGPYFIGKGTRVWCAKVGSSFVSLGGDGSTQELAASSCFANPYISSYTPSDGKKWVDPDATADNTANAKKIVCPGNGLAKTSAARTCKEIRINFPTSKNGIYWLNGRNMELKSAPFQAFCWNTDRDGGGWTMFLRSYYEGHQRPVYNGNGVSDSGDVNDDILQFLGGAYKLDDKKIRAIIGQKDITDGGRASSKKGMFSYMVDQSKWNDYYSDNNKEYGVMKKYTARWRFVRFQQMDSSSTSEEFTSYAIPNFDGKTPVGDGTVNWKGRPRCGSRYMGGGAGAGISCRDTHNGKPQRSPRGGRGCTKNTGRNRWGGSFHLYMLNTNHDTYMYICNGPQHSSYRRFAHRWYIRTADTDKVA